ncbi:uncharacterized protein LOC107268729 [Cephus cinctus]|uniref:Regulatory protein zeste n=1 Tax=Cephus cinctus TaxID=211228 RepID=A0AAJ7FL63_CEPCN|nr:uncharacterized protein LOC107268729 [Cephus cinctus]
MLDFFLLNKGLAEGKFSILNGKNEAQKKWTELTKELNLIKGAAKTSEQWQVVWRDLKSRTSTKIRDLRKRKAATGNKALDLPPLTVIEERIVGIVGTSYIEGNRDCADSIPEEEDLQEALAEGNTSVLSLHPTVSSIYINSEIPLQEESANVSSEAPNVSPIPPTNVSTSYLRGEKCKVRACTSRTTRTTNSQTSEALRYLSSAREEFQMILKEQTKAMNMLAETAKIQADAAMLNATAMQDLAKASIQLAEAASVQTANEEKRIPIMAKLIDVLSNLLPNYLDENI